jgi:hypothetical protein
MFGGSSLYSSVAFFNWRVVEIHVLYDLKARYSRIAFAKIAKWTTALRLLAEPGLD